MKTGIAIISMISIILASSPVTATERHFNVGVEELDYLPYYTSKGNNYQGYARELLDAFAKERGYTFDYKPLPVKRLFQSLLKKQVDFKFPDNPNWQSDLKKKFVSSIVNRLLHTSMVSWFRKGKRVLGLVILKNLEQSWDLRRGIIWISFRKARLP